MYRGLNQGLFGQYSGDTAVETAVGNASSMVMDQ